ncbi:MAG: low molecular weight phosphatase family protein [Candidatus Nanopelagicales bacterium]
MPAPRLLFVCTGNATRSVIAEALVRRDRPDWRVTSAGTWAIPGLPSSRRTLAALESVGVSAPGHRSRTLSAHHLDDADLVVTFERDHVAYIRQRFPAAAAYTTTLPSLLDSAWPLPDLALVNVRDLREVDDPAGGEIEDFVACAQAISADVSALLPRLDSWPGGPA